MRVRLSKKVVISLILVLIILFVSAYSTWSTGWLVVNDGVPVNVLVTAAETCHGVTNSGSYTYFVPTKTTAEWDAFASHLPSGVSVGLCWVSYFNTDYWEPLFGEDTSWYNSQWQYMEGSDLGVWLTDIGTWTNGFRPSKVRVSFNQEGCSENWFVLDDESGAGIVDAEPYTSAMEVNITWGSYNLNELKISSCSDYYPLYVTNIEFLIE